MALTTNGTLLPRFAEQLAAAGLTRVNISLDSLDPERYAAITRGGDLAAALAGLRVALDTGFDPVKVNVVATAGVAGEIDAFLALAAENPVHVRFIERMPIGQSCSSASDEAPLSADEVASLVAERAAGLGLGSLVPATDAERPPGWGPARYYRLPGAQGTVGVIAPVSRHFCDTCSRLRLTADGNLRPCLFSDEESPFPKRSPDQATRRSEPRYAPLSPCDPPGMARWTWTAPRAAPAAVRCTRSEVRTRV